MKQSILFILSKVKMILGISFGIAYVTVTTNRNEIVLGLLVLWLLAELIHYLLK